MELDWIRYLAKILPNHPRLALGIGDDAAVLEWGPGSQCVVAVDVVSDGTDFHLREIDPALAGRKALAVNLSDLAAMAAEPVAAVVALGLPRENARSLAERVYEGLLAVAEEYKVAVAGGDTHIWDGPFFLAVTVLGLPGPGGIWRRDGAKPNDVILVTGSLGGSILGKHLHFRPRVREALHLAQNYEVHAAIDISDGLLLDLARMAEASAVAAEISLAAIPVDPAAERLSREEGNKRSPLEHALSDGEDYELILAVPEAEAERMLRDSAVGVPLTAIGRFVTGEGLWQVEGNSRIRLKPAGYVHGERLELFGK
jgi:thiamine-monophosphate kinase